MEEKKMKRKIGFLTILAMLISLLTINTSAAQLGKVTRIYGSETRAIACGDFDKFYASDFFVWFMLDTDINAKPGYSEINRQVLGDSVIRPSARDKIRIGGMTVNQHNVSSGNPYTAMIAYEENGSGKLRMAVWLSWGGQSIQDVFNQELYDEILFETLSGLMVPDYGYSLSNQVYRELEPVKYKLNISELEFKDNPSHPGYTQDKASWFKPMFEELDAQWVKVGEATPTKAPTAVPTATPTLAPTSQPGATVTPTESSVEESSDISSPEETPTEDPSEVSTDSEVSSEEPTQQTTQDPSESEETSTPDENGNDNNKGSALPIIFAIIGLIVIGGGVGYFIYMKKKA